VRLRIFVGTLMGRRGPVLALLFLLGVGCGGEPSSDVAGSAETIRVMDASGAEVVLAAPARRIVSLVPSATETLRAIGAAEALVGRTDFDTEAWASALPSVGGGLEPNMEAIVALRPDLVIRFEGTQDPRTPVRLDELGITHLSVRPDHVEDIYTTAIVLGTISDRESQADSLVHSIQERLHELSQVTGRLPRRRVAYVLGGTPPWVAGPGTFIDEVVSLVGGDNVFADLGALYSSVSPEQLRSRDIDVVLVSGATAFDATLTPSARIEDVGDALEIPGPDVVDAAYYVAELLHGRSLR
jgi:iron complex transport system substrate-binding protein